MPDALMPFDGTAPQHVSPHDPAAGAAVRRVLDAIGSVTRSTEADFLEIGERLESAIGVVGRLAGTFDALHGELQGEALRGAARDLSDAAERVGAIVGAQHDEQATLMRLGDLARAIERRVPAMGKAIKAVEVLAINAKIASAGIATSDADFRGFLNGLTRPLAQAQVSLDRFGSELGEVNQRVRAARADQEQFARRQAEAIGSIPRRLAASVDAMAAHGARAAAAAAAIGRKSEQVRDRIAAAISALQIGDATRQRVEHVIEAIGLLVDARSAVPGWTAMTAAQRDGATAVLLRLQAAQLTDAAEELERELARLADAFADLEADARDIIRLGQEAYAGSDRRHGGFFLELQEQVDAARALLQAFGDARRDAGRVVAAVSDAVGRLVGHISAIDSLEADLRIMGLNTTLKCARLGALGRPLSVIAQELRVYAGDTATEARAVMTDLAQARSAAAALTHAEASGDDIGVLGEIMTGSMACFDAAGQSLAGALATLDRDSAAVARSLTDAAARAAERTASSGALHQAARDLLAVAERCDQASADAGPARDALLGAVERRYTMERERAIHERVVHGRALPPIQVAAPAAATTNIDDMLF